MTTNTNNNIDETKKLKEHGELKISSIADLVFASYIGGILITETAYF
jgi:hypothetical protein